MKIGVLDQSPVIRGHTSAQAIAETIRLARAAERFGYTRYWLAEHHSIAALADPCPEVLLARVAAETQSIRVGTGGVLLPYYSPLKVAEVFRMLEAMYPGRIDLGIGRAPGGDRITAAAMTPDGSGQYLSAQHFPQQVVDLAGFLRNDLPPDHPFVSVRAQPGGPGIPQIWLLGSSDYSAALAAHLGLRFAFAHFISASGGDGVTRAYRRDFQPSVCEATPTSMVAVFALCAPTQEEAERLAASIDLRRVRMEQGIDLPQPDDEEALRYRYDPREEMRRQSNRSRIVIGTPDLVRVRLQEIQQAFEADEVMVIGITGDYATRLRSYELIAQACGLAPRD